MLILAIDPGPKVSGVVCYASDDRRVTFADVMNNDDVFRIPSPWDADVAVIEKVESYGMAVGESVFETCRVAGRFHQHFLKRGATIVHMPRKDVKLHLCGSARAKDANVSCVLRDRFGGQKEAVGTKKNPGPLYGVKSHAWAALALAVCYAEGVRP